MISAICLIFIGSNNSSGPVSHQSFPISHLNKCPCLLKLSSPYEIPYHRWTVCGKVDTQWTILSLLCHCILLCFKLPSSHTSFDTLWFKQTCTCHLLDQQQRNVLICNGQVYSYSQINSTTNNIPWTFEISICAYQG